MDWDEDKPKHYPTRGKPPKHKYVYCHETKKYYKTYKEAAHDIDGDEFDIAKVCKGKRRHHKGYHFVFEDL